jgi:hypothetical protein
MLPRRGHAIFPSAFVFAVTLLLETAPSMYPSPQLTQIHAAIMNESKLDAWKQLGNEKELPLPRSAVFGGDDNGTSTYSLYCKSGPLSCCSSASAETGCVLHYAAMAP